MRVGMILANQPFPPDIRVEKEIAALTDPDHEFVVLCRADDRAAVEQCDDHTVVRHAVHPGSPLRRRLDSLRFLLTQVSPSWRDAIVALVREHDLDVVHVHDLPYTRTGIVAARRAGARSVIDLHENHPAALAIWKRRLLDRILLSPARAARLERWSVANADATVVVVDEARERLVAGGADPDRVCVFGNAEPAAIAERETAPPSPSTGPRLAYVGGIAPHRGLETAVDAMPAILRERPAATLTIVGRGHTLPDLVTHAERTGVAESTEFTGWLELDEAMGRVADADIALVPHVRSAHTDATVPHKLFQYMALGRPVVVSDCGPLARIVDETGAGRVFASGDAASLAAAVLELTDDDVAHAAGEAGRRAVRERWNIERDVPALLAAYDGSVSPRDGDATTGPA